MDGEWWWGFIDVVWLVVVGWWWRVRVVWIMGLLVGVDCVGGLC